MNGDSPSKRKCVIVGWSTRPELNFITTWTELISKLKKMKENSIDLLSNSI